MSESIDNVEDVSPYKLLLNFSTSRVLPCIFVATLVHALIIGGFSTSYIYYTWVDPSAAQKDEKEDDESSKTGDSEEPAAKKSTEGKQDPASTKSGKMASAGKKTDDKTAPVVKRVTDKPKADEIPTEPGGLGLPIDGLDKN